MSGSAVWLRVVGSFLRILPGGTLRQRLRVIGFLAVLVLLFPPWWLVCLLCLALDHVLFPGFRRVTIDRPLFVIGNMRTGSTWIQRLLAQDPDFTSLTLGDLLLPAILQKRLAAAAGRLDAALGGHARRLLLRADRRALADYSRIHPVGLEKPEEDEVLLLYAMGSALLGALCPDDPALQALVHFDTRLPVARQDRLLATYRGLIQRHLFHVGGGRLLSKNPWFSGKVSALHRTFPDACFLYLARDPRRVVPSTASLIHFVWHRLGVLDADQQDLDYVFGICAAFYSDTLKALEQLPSDRYAVVRHEDLCSDLPGALQAAWLKLGWTMGPELAGILAAESQQERHAPVSHYTLAGWGLTGEGVLARLEAECAPLGYPLSPER